MGPGRHQRRLSLIFDLQIEVHLLENLGLEMCQQLLPVPRRRHTFPGEIFNRISGREVLPGRR